MATLYYKVLKYLEANSKTVSEFDSNIKLRNEGTGDGDYIAIWNVSGLAKPNDSQLNNLNSTSQTEENNAIIKETRRVAYKSIESQLDKLWHDIDDEKLDKNGSWYKAIKAVKDANSKE